jgi:hypothetical protein
MERLTALSTGTKVMLAAAILLLIDMFFRWQEVCASFAGNEVCGGQNGWNGFWGVVLGLLTIVLLVWAGLQIAQVDLSSVNLPASETLITAGIGALIFLFALIKNLVDDYSTIWSYIGVILAAGVAIGAWLRMQETGTPLPRRAAASEPVSTTPPPPPSTEPAPPPPPPSSTPPPPPAESA